MTTSLHRNPPRHLILRRVLATPFMVALVSLQLVSLPLAVIISTIMGEEI